MNEKINVGIVEDNEELRKNLKHILELLGEFHIIFSLDDGSKVMDCLKQGKIPEVILMDLEMPVQDGIQTTRLVKENFPDVKVLIHTVFDDKSRVFDALRNGADGYLLKGEKPRKMLESILQIKEGRLPMSPNIASKALAFFKESDISQTTKIEEYKLTKREMSVLERLCLGSAYKQIADELFISERTVNSHVNNIYKKLRVNNAISASNIASKNKWFQ
ncbi:MAG: response regulator transcription factor [Flavobacteriales bacterium]|nr:response regulator transcription factor [Flavobacteriales bacterium]